jgi:hypothetical protein
MSEDLVRSTLAKYLRFVKPSGPHNMGGPCPFHKDGQERRPSFYMNTLNGMFYCHTCHASGNFQTFLRMVGVRRSHIDMIMEGTEFETRASIDRKRNREDFTRVKESLPESLLGVFDFAPVSLLRAGFAKKLLRELDVGFDKRTNRITFPIRDLYGNLAGISGRTVMGEFPRYKVYGEADLVDTSPDDDTAKDRYRGYAIKSHNYLWNMHRIYPSVFMGKDLPRLVVVEGYKACMWLLQHGIDAVALQGSRMTWAQERILLRLATTIVLLLDNDKAGILGTYDTSKRLRSMGARVLCCTYPDEYTQQPDDMDEEELAFTVENALTPRDWRKRCRIRPK